MEKKKYALRVSLVTAGLFALSACADDAVFSTIEGLSEQVIEQEGGNNNFSDDIVNDDHSDDSGNNNNHGNNDNHGSNDQGNNNSHGSNDNQDEELDQQIRQNGCSFEDVMEFGVDEDTLDHGTTVLICMVPPGNPSAKHNKCVGRAAVYNAFLSAVGRNHAEQPYLGPCEQDFIL